MELKVEYAANWLRHPKKWVLSKRESPTRIGWDVVGAFVTKREALEALKQRKAELSN